MLPDLFNVHIFPDKIAAFVSGMYCTCTVQGLPREFILGSENEVVKCSASQLKHTLRLNISAGQLQNMGKTLLRNSVHFYTYAAQQGSLEVLRKLMMKEGRKEKGQETHLPQLELAGGNGPERRLSEMETSHWKCAVAY